MYSDAFSLLEIVSSEEVSHCIYVQTKFVCEGSLKDPYSLTAIKEIWAKPTIDILVEIPREEKVVDLKGTIERCGYICMAENDSRIDFNKGYTLQGFAERVFHLHLCYEGDNDELYFRDYLQANTAIAKEYERLKLDLWKQYEHDRNMYTSHKGDFVKQYTQKGKLLFTGRYDNK